MDYYVPFLNRSLDKKKLSALLLWVRFNCGESEALKLVENLKSLGFSTATHFALSLGIDDLAPPKDKNQKVITGEHEIAFARTQWKQGKRTSIELFQQIVDTWHQISENLKDQVIDQFHGLERMNSVYMMAFSGARGNLSQVRQLVSMRGLMANPQGEIVGFPIVSNFREGLTMTEYFVSCYGARKGVIDTALRTADAGYLTRRLVDVAHHVVVRNNNCGTTKYISLKSNKKGLSLAVRLVGRVSAETIYAPTKRVDLRSCYTPTIRAVVAITKGDGEEGSDRKVNAITNPVLASLSVGDRVEGLGDRGTYVKPKVRASLVTTISRSLASKPVAELDSYQEQHVEIEGGALKEQRSNRGGMSPSPKAIESEGKKTQPTKYKFTNKKFLVPFKQVTTKPIIIKNQEITEQIANSIVTFRNKVKVRSPLTCVTPVCQLCYGYALAENRRVSIGEAVGILAAQSLGEPGTQLTLRTFHTGGVFSGDQVNALYAPYEGRVYFSDKLSGDLIRTAQGDIAFLTSKKSILHIIPESSNFKVLPINTQRVLTTSSLPSLAVRAPSPKPSTPSLPILAKLAPQGQRRGVAEGDGTSVMESEAKMGQRRGKPCTYVPRSLSEGYGNDEEGVCAKRGRKGYPVGERTSLVTETEGKMIRSVARRPMALFTPSVHSKTLPNINDSTRYHKTFLRDTNKQQNHNYSVAINIGTIVFVRNYQYVLKNQLLTNFFSQQAKIRVTSEEYIFADFSGQVVHLLPNMNFWVVAAVFPPKLLSSLRNSRFSYNNLFYPKYFYTSSSPSPKVTDSGAKKKVMQSPGLAVAFQGKKEYPKRDARTPSLPLLAPTGRASLGAYVQRASLAVPVLASLSIANHPKGDSDGDRSKEGDPGAAEMQVMTSLNAPAGRRHRRWGKRYESSILSFQTPPPFYTNKLMVYCTSLAPSCTYVSSEAEPKVSLAKLLPTVSPIAVAEGDGDGQVGASRGNEGVRAWRASLVMPSLAKIHLQFQKRIFLSSIIKVRFWSSQYTLSNFIMVYYSCTFIQSYLGFAWKIKTENKVKQFQKIISNKQFSLFLHILSKQDSTQYQLRRTLTITSYLEPDLAFPSVRKKGDILIQKQHGITFGVTCTYVLYPEGVSRACTPSSPSPSPKVTASPSVTESEAKMPRRGTYVQKSAKRDKQGQESWIFDSRTVYVSSSTSLIRASSPYPELMIQPEGHVHVMAVPLQGKGSTHMILTGTNFSWHDLSKQNLSRNFTHQPLEQIKPSIFPIHHNLKMETGYFVYGQNKCKQKILFKNEAMPCVPLQHQKTLQCYINNNDPVLASLSITCRAVPSEAEPKVSHAPIAFGDGQEGAYPFEVRGKKGQVPPKVMIQPERYMHLMASSPITHLITPGALINAGQDLYMQLSPSPLATATATATATHYIENDRQRRPTTLLSGYRRHLYRSHTYHARTWIEDPTLLPLVAPCCTEGVGRASLDTYVQVGDARTPSLPLLAPTCPSPSPSATAIGDTVGKSFARLTFGSASLGTYVQPRRGKSFASNATAKKMHDFLWKQQQGNRPKQNSKKTKLEKQVFTASESGQVIKIDSNRITLRRAHCYFISSKGSLSVVNKEYIKKGNGLFNLRYEKLLTGDIVQGLGKIEELLEYPKLSLNLNFKTCLRRYLTKISLDKAIQWSYADLQIYLVQSIQQVYVDQGCFISDKHLEIIVRQATCFGIILFPGDTGFLHHEVVPIENIEKINKQLISLQTVHSSVPVLTSKEYSSSASLASLKVMPYVSCDAPIPSSPSVMETEAKTPVIEVDGHQNQYATYVDTTCRAVPSEAEPKVSHAMPSEAEPKVSHAMPCHAPIAFVDGQEGARRGKKGQEGDTVGKSFASDADNYAYKKNKKVQKAIYYPHLKGITWNSLNSNSILSAASFQETRRVLRDNLVTDKVDFLKGIKERIILGELLEIGTGFFKNRT